jgi:hypothetical protein
MKGVLVYFLALFLGFCSNMVYLRLFRHHGTFMKICHMLVIAILATTFIHEFFN